MPMTLDNFRSLVNSLASGLTEGGGERDFGDDSKRSPQEQFNGLLRSSGELSGLLSEEPGAGKHTALGLLLAKLDSDKITRFIGAISPEQLRRLITTEETVSISLREDSEEGTNFTLKGALIYRMPEASRLLEAEELEVDAFNWPVYFFVVSRESESQAQLALLKKAKGTASSPRAFQSIVTLSVWADLLESIAPETFDWLMQQFEDRVLTDILKAKPALIKQLPQQKSSVVKRVIRLTSLDSFHEQLSSLDLKGCDSEKSVIMLLALVKTTAYLVGRAKSSFDSNYEKRKDHFNRVLNFLTKEVDQQTTEDDDPFNADSLTSLRGWWRQHYLDAITEFHQLWEGCSESHVRKEFLQAFQAFFHQHQATLQGVRITEPRWPQAAQPTNALVTGAGASLERSGSPVELSDLQKKLELDEPDYQSIIEQFKPESIKNVERMEKLCGHQITGGRTVLHVIAQAVSGEENTYFGNLMTYMHQFLTPETLRDLLTQQDATEETPISLLMKQTSNHELFFNTILPSINDRLELLDERPLVPESAQLNVRAKCCLISLWAHVRANKPTGIFFTRPPGTLVSFQLLVDQLNMASGDVASHKGTYAASASRYRDLLGTLEKVYQQDDEGLRKFVDELNKAVNPASRNEDAEEPEREASLPSALAVGR